LAGYDLADAALDASTKEAEDTMKQSKEKFDDKATDIAALQKKIEETKVQDVIDDINAEIGTLTAEQATFQEDYLDAQADFNFFAEQKIVLTTQRDADRVIFEKEEAFSDAQSEMNKFDRKIADLNQRLVDFQGYARMKSGSLPVCSEGMFLDYDEIPQLDMSYVMEKLQDIPGFNDLTLLDVGYDFDEETGQIIGWNEHSEFGRRGSTGDPMTDAIIDTMAIT
jgi:hypothetical protein